MKLSKEQIEETIQYCEKQKALNLKLVYYNPVKIIEILQELLEARERELQFDNYGLFHDDVEFVEYIKTLEARNKKLEALIKKALPSTMGIYPDLCAPEGYEQRDTTDAWEAWETDVQKLLQASRKVSKKKTPVEHEPDCATWKYSGRSNPCTCKLKEKR